MTDESKDDKREPVGSMIDGLGIRTAIPEGWLLVDAMVVFKFVDDRGVPVVRHTHGPSLDWLTRRAMIEVVRDVERLTSADTREAS